MVKEHGEAIRAIQIFRLQEVAFEISIGFLFRQINVKDTQLLVDQCCLPHRFLISTQSTTENI